MNPSHKVKSTLGSYLLSSHVLTTAVRAAIYGHAYIQDSIWFTLAYCLLQDWPSKPRQFQTSAQFRVRYLSISAALMSAILYATFSSNFMVIKVNHVQPGLQDLISPGIKFGVCEGSYLLNAVKLAEPSTTDFTAYGEKKVIDRLFTNLDIQNSYPPLKDGL